MVGNKWVWRLKKLATSIVDKLKSRIVAKSFDQTPGFDFSETFKLVMKQITVRIIITIALSKRWSLYQLDVNNAFLNSVLTEKVYMLQPVSFKDPMYIAYVCICKEIYGLKQISRASFNTLKATLFSLYFIQSQVDVSLLYSSLTLFVIFLMVYVDDN